MADLLAVAYVLVIELLRAQWSAAHLASSIARSLGADVEPPDWHEVRADFDMWLMSPPVVEDPDRAIQRAALGL